jgi:hypothetical protein
VPQTTKLYKRYLVWVLGVLITSGLIGFVSAQAATIKAGTPCVKVGNKSGNYVCTKVKTKLVWQIKKINQKISHNFPTELPLSEQALSLILVSSAGLDVKALVLTPKNCGVIEGNFYTYKVGYCLVRISQSGDKFTNAVKSQDLKIVVKGSNEISLLAPETVKLADRFTTLKATSTSELKVVGTSQTPTVCRMVQDELQFLSKGRCDVQWAQKGDEFHSPAVTVTTSIKIMLSNQITATFEKEYKQSQSRVTTNPSSTSGYPVSLRSETSTICSVNGKDVEFLIPGRCQVTFTQGGDEFVEAASPLQLSFTIVGKNQISFALPSSLLLSIKSFALDGKSSSGLPVYYESTTPTVCTVSAAVASFLTTGKCEIRASQPASEFYEVATPVVASTTISATRSFADQPDSFKGFQVKPIYVLPSDVSDNLMDTNGSIASYLTEGRDFVFKQIGVTIPVDRIGSGYDIQFMRSRYTSTQLMTMPSGPGDELMIELGAMESPGVNRKNYIFFIDIPYMNDGTIFCGRASTPGFISIVAAGSGNTPSGSCNGKSANINNYISLIWVHEMFHNLGVDHTSGNSCEFMRASGSCNSEWVIDPNRSSYVNSSSSGIDIMKLRVWEGKTNDTSLIASCTLPYNYLPRADGKRYAYCPTGSQTVGALTSCWNSIGSAELEFLNGSSWVSLGGASQSTKPWGNASNWQCGKSGYVAPTKQITVTTPGVVKYRWLVNGSVSEEFTIIWVE